MSGSGDKGRADNPDLAGFTARAYKNTRTNEIVIVYAGTHNQDKSGDIWQDALLGCGFSGMQAN